MDGPRVGWTGGRVGVPELSLQQGTAGIVIAAGRGLGRAVAAQGVVVGASLQVGRDTGEQLGSSQGQHARRG